MKDVSSNDVYNIHCLFTSVKLLRQNVFPLVGVKVMCVPVNQNKLYKIRKSIDMRNNEDTDVETFLIILVVFL